MIHEYTRRDKYGRTVHHFEDTEAWHQNRRRATVVVVVLPKAAADPTTGARHMLNDWQVEPGPDKAHPKFKGLAAARVEALRLLAEHRTAHPAARNG